MKSLRASNGATFPLKLGAFAAASGLRSGFSLRNLMKLTGSRTAVVRVAFLRYRWETPAPAMGPQPAMWNDYEVREMFFAENLWSVEQFWWRNTMGLLDIVGDIFPWKILPGKQVDLDGPRRDLNARIRAQAAADGFDLSNYDRVISIVDPPPGDRGAVSAPGDVIIDELPFSFEFFQHEVGHLLGLHHTFGKAQDGVWRAYNDFFDVMGQSGTRTRNLPTPAGLAAIPLPTFTNQPSVNTFWKSARRLSAASLYRYLPEFRYSQSVVRISSFPATVRLVALTHGRLGDAVVIVVQTRTGEVTVEYRTKDEDDTGLSEAPILVMHTISRRPLPSGASEVDPIVYESSGPASPGNRVFTPEGDIAATVVGGGGGAPSVTIRMDKAP
jgi:hypothetical protein